MRAKKSYILKLQPIWTNRKTIKKHKKVVMTALEQRTLAIEHATKPELFFSIQKVQI